MVNRCFIIILFLTQLGEIIFAQSDKLLFQLDDTSRIIEYKRIGHDYYDINDYTNGILYYQKAMDLSDSLIKKNEHVTFAKRAKIDAYRYIGLNIEHTDSFDIAPNYFNTGLQLAMDNNFYDKQCVLLGNIGMHYYNAGDYPLSLNYSLRQLQLAIKLGDKYRMASAYNRIGINYKRQMMHDQALENLFASVNLFLETEDSSEVANGWNNIGNVYFNMKQYKQAYEYYQKEKEFGVLLHDDELVADAYNCTAQIFNEVSNQSIDSISYYFNYSTLQLSELTTGFLLDSAILYFNLAIEFYSTESKVYELADCFNGLGKTYTLQKNYIKAIQAFHKAYELAKFEGVLQKEMSASIGLYSNYRQLNQFDSSLFWYETFNLIQDSIFSDTKSREIGKLESRHDFEVKEAELLAQQNQERAVAETAQSNQRIIILIVSIGLILVFILMLLLFNRFQLIKKQKHQIEFHKLELESKQKEIVDSITYAKRLQHALLAPQKDIQKYFPNSFLLYKPKDIVAGDFYFFEKTDSHIFYAAADCTGHGVPGAMVSIVCSNALTRSIKEFGLIDPAKILNKTKELVVETFEKSGQDVKDGMDISFITKDLSTNKITWAGAHNALWIYHENSFKEIKADKQPIGKSPFNETFHSHEINLEKNSALYLFTDGYADQFGGENLPNGKEGGKKFKASRFKELLLNIHTKPLNEQKNILDQTFEDWRGNLEQLDDVCVIGIQV